MDIKCPKCETNNHSDSKFCKECAAPLPSQGDSFTKTIETPTKELTTGSIFAGRYKIVEELGQGGMGRIYRALDNELKEEAAIDQLEALLAAQTGLVISRELLRIDPIWDPLRGNPRFEKLLKDPLSNND